uniref:Uncharacterized protein n=1 Tax=Leptobrachium leishanense TaxID=445787 RepID=A0A8C5Q5Q2_9ANUR
MISLWFHVPLLLLDSSLTYISSGIVYTHYPSDLLAAAWIVSLVKFLILGLVSLKLYHPAWVSSSPLYVLTVCLTPPLHQTLRPYVTSHSPELYSGLSGSLISHITLLAACLIWDLAMPNKIPQPPSGEDSNGKEKNHENFIRLLKYSKPDWIPLSVAFIFMALALISEMFIPYYMGRVIDILSSSYKETVFLMAIFYMTIFSITSYLNFHYIFKSATLNKMKIWSIAGNVNITLRTLVKCIGVYSFMISISWQLTLLTFLSSPLTWIIQKLYNRYHRDLVQKVQDSVAKSSDIAKEILESVRTVHSFDAVEIESKRYDASLDEIHQLQSRRDFVRALYLLIVNLAAQVVMLIYGQTLIENGFLSSGKMMSFILYQMESGSYIRTLVYMLSEITHSTAAAHKVFHYLDREPQVSTSGSYLPDKLKGGFEFKNVTFSYPSRKDTPAIQDISFKLPPGSITALVGPSGGGKTTCVSLLERFYKPDSGEILLDGIPIHQYQHKYLHTKVALVAQEPVLFSGSVIDNISYGLDSAPEEQLKEAARKANAEAFIQGMEKGYDTDVGENGSQLGAGQKQRLAMARALARKPKLLILDEASSSLDAETEHEIQKSLSGLDGLSLLIIAHKLRTIQKADQILVLEGGRLAECGKHEELIERKGVYYRLLHGHILQNGE